MAIEELDDRSKNRREEEDVQFVLVLPPLTLKLTHREGTRSV